MSSEEKVVKVINYDDSLTMRKVKESVVDGLRYIEVQEASPRVRAARGGFVREVPAALKPSVIKVINFAEGRCERHSKTAEVDGLVTVNVMEAAPAMRPRGSSWDWTEPPQAGQSAIKIIHYDDSLTDKEVKQIHVGGLTILHVQEASPAVRKARA